MARLVRKLQRLRGDVTIEDDLSPYQALVEAIGQQEERLRSLPDRDLQARARELKARAKGGLDAILVETFALVREATRRTIGLRPFDVQLMAGIALHRGRLIEMQTGEGKTLAAVLPACLNALTGKGVHVLTFNDYLARRDEAWMGPAYRFMGLTTGAIQESMSPEARRRAYQADVTYATAKEAGFDFLRGFLARDVTGLVHRPFHYVIVDEADSLLIDEARVPLVIAGPRPASDISPYRVAEVIRALEEGADFETDENGRNVFLTEGGIDRVEAELACGDLHEDSNYLLLTEVNQALHARALLHRDVDYIVREARIELVDEFIGRVVDDRRWPDGLQAAIEAKEGLTIQPGGRILGTIALQHFLLQYPKRSGMSATLRPATRELDAFYGLRIVPIPPDRPCIRKDLPDVIFTHKDARDRALVEEIRREHERGRPVLVGTASIEASEALAHRLLREGISCQVLNAKNDEAEAAIIARAGMPGAVTISTNMAGRGTDIRLGGPDEAEREAVVSLGGLYVIGTNRHESRRIDDQLRGRAGRQGDPGLSRFFISLEDDLMVRFGIDGLIPPALRPAPQAEPFLHPAIRREIERLQRIVEGQNYDVRRTLWRYSDLVELQRQIVQSWRTQLLLGEVDPEICAGREPERYRELSDRFGPAVVREAERAILIHHIDECWAEHLERIADLREGIHLVGIGGQDPLREFHRQITGAFDELEEQIAARTAKTFHTATITENGLNMEQAGLQGPSSTWTYRTNDRVLTELQQMLFGQGNAAFAAGAVLMTWPLLAAWGFVQWLRRKRGTVNGPG